MMVMEFIMASNINREERYRRQQEIIPRDVLDKLEVTVIGVGAIGRQTALQLAAIGVPKLNLIDMDTVEVVNLAAQGFLEADIGKAKVDAVASQCKKINKSIKIKTFNTDVNTLLRPTNDDGRELLASLSKIVFCCVDNISLRGVIFQTVEPNCELFLDSRMAAEAIRILAYKKNDESATSHNYERTLFSEVDAVQDSCTAKTTIYTASIAAGLMLGQFTKYLRNFPVDRDTLLSLLAMEIIQDAGNQQTCY